VHPTCSGRMGSTNTPMATAYGDQLREFLNRNRLRRKRARSMNRPERWWKSLDALIASTILVG